jgi:Flp pilus assembly protein TadG
VSQRPGGALGRGRNGWRADGGYVTAETAVLLPALVLLMALLVWGVLVAAAQLRCIDAARVAARAAARGDADPVSQARAVAPSGAAIEVDELPDTVRVLVEARCPGIGRLASVMSLKVSAVAVAANETAAVAVDATERK